MNCCAIRPHQTSCAFDSGNDRHIARTTADIAAQAMFNFFFAGIWVLTEQRICRQNHARGAVTAFKSAFLPEGLLYRMEFIALSQAFDGRDRLIMDLKCRGHAGTDGSAIDQHSTGTANLHFATLPRSFKTELIAEKVGK